MKKIIFENVSKSFGDVKVLDNISFEVNAEEAMMILGQSGVGKSVTLKLMLGLQPLDSGDITINGISVLDSKRKHEYRSFFSVLFQGCALFDSMTVMENIIFTLQNHGFDARQSKQIAEENILSVGLSEECFNMYPASLSGGMQKRVALARAIAVRPEIIVLDEPTSGLDPVTSLKVSTLIKSLLNQSPVTSLTITHDMNVAMCFGTHVAMLHSANIVWRGTISEMASSTNDIVSDFMRASGHG